MSLREVVDEWVDRGLDAVLEDTNRTPTAIAPANRLIVKLITVDVPVSFHTYVTVTQDSTIVGITAENRRNDASVTVLQPIIHVGSSVVVRDRGYANLRSELSTGQQYVFKMVVDTDEDNLHTQDSLDGDEVDRYETHKENRNRV